MTRESFEKSILACLKEQYSRYPRMRQEDVVKFVFQAMLGPGHLLSGRKTVTERITLETEGLSGNRAEPLFERLSPAWCRLSLRRAAADGIPPSAVAGMILAFPADGRFSRQDVLDFCAALREAGDPHVTGETTPGPVPDEAWLPSHSAAYREAYRPAYRVISSYWISCIEAVRGIAGKQAASGRMLVTVDGPCASGKTTLASRLAGVFEAAVVHTDDYVVPHARKTAGRLAVPGGNCDVERLAAEVVIPWKKGLPVTVRRYDCHTDRMLPGETIPPDSGMLILEGSYSNLPDIAVHADFRIFTDTPEAVRMDRLLRRESPESMRMFRDRWIPLEQAYFDAYHLPGEDCTVVKGAPVTPDGYDLCRPEDTADKKQ